MEQFDSLSRSILPDKILLLLTEEGLFCSIGKMKGTTSQSQGIMACCLGTQKKAAEANIASAARSSAEAA